MEVDAELLFACSSHPGEERGDVARGRAAGVHDKVGVQGGHFGPAFAPALGPDRLDQPPRVIALGIPAIRAAEVAMCSPITDDRDLQRSIREIVTTVI